MMKVLGGGTLTAAALYFGGVFDTSYSRVVGRPPADVSNALVDLDITAAPGEPGSEATQSGGVRPVIRLERGTDKLVWVVMSGNKVATRMIAHLEPVDGGKQTRVWAEVERGDAADDYVSPAFRSKNLTLGLFSVVLEAELNQLIAGGTGWGEHCQAILDRVKAEGEARAEANFAEAAEQGPNLGAAMGRVAKMNLQLNAIDTELRNAGCNPDRPNRGMRQVEQRMTAGESGRDVHPDVSFEPGKPMIDLTGARR